MLLVVYVCFSPSKRVSNIIKFLEGLFQHPSHTREFITKADGLNRFGRLTALACLPYDFANSVASDSMVQVVRSMLESSTTDVLQHLLTMVKDSLKATEDLWSGTSFGSRLLSFVDIDGAPEW
jgi:E3 ubiquitin-protein ligase HUWE1